MNTLQIDLGGGASIALPAEKAVAALIQHLKAALPVQPRYRVGEYAAGQGGIFAGTILGDDGVTYGLVKCVEQDIGKFAWGPTGERDLSQWDGLGNTNRLNKADHPASFAAAKYEKDGHLDFYLPSRREMMIMLANVPRLFNKKDWYWTSTPHTEHYAWAVGFEDGNVLSFTRSYECRVCPVRRLSL